MSESVSHPKFVVAQERVRSLIIAVFYKSYFHWIWRGCRDDSQNSECGTIFNRNCLIGVFMEMSSMHLKICGH